MQSYIQIFNHSFFILRLFLFNVTFAHPDTYHLKIIAMKILFFVLSSIFGFGVFAQQPVTIDDPQAKVRPLNGSFSGITLSDGIELYLTSGTEESLAVSFSDEKYDERFKTEIVGDVLKIYYDNNGINYSDNKRRKLKAYVSFKTLKKLSASGGATVKLPVGITVGNLAMKFSSGAEFNGEVKADDLSVDQNSGAEISLSGSASSIKIDISSGAIFKGYEFKADFCTAKASSGAEIRISVDKELNARANSGGGIHYKGTAVIKDINISSGGFVKKA